MEAFAPCVPIGGPREFLGGAKRGTERVPCGAPSRDTRPSTIRALKLPNLPNLPKLDVPKIGFPNLLLPRKSKAGAPEAPAASTPPAAPPVPTRPRADVNRLSIGGKQVVTGSEFVERKKASRASRSFMSGDLPKFYNPSTARYLFRSVAAGQGETAFDVRVGAAARKSTNERVNDQGTFRNMDVYTEDLVWARPEWSEGEASTAIAVAIRNFFGNANLFESELEELASSISCARDTGDMKEFVRAMGLSEAYRKRFFEPCSNGRFVELNFKHFLGRAPRSQEEFATHIRIVNDQGYNAEINSYVDSKEYDSLWGTTRVPTVNFRGGHPCNSDMNRLAVLNGTFSDSDRTSTDARVPFGEVKDLGATAVLNGLPQAWRGENEARNSQGPLMSFPSDRFWNLAPELIRQAELQWISTYGRWTKFYYKDSALYKEIFTPNLNNTAEEKAEAAAVLKYGSLMAKNFVGTK